MRQPIISALMVLCLSSISAIAATVKLTEEKTLIRVEIDGKHFTDYHFAAGSDQAFHRPYCYPVNAADGQCVTSDQILTNPKEHPHHRSFWVAHGDVNGVDHWTHLTDKKQLHLKFDKLEGDTIVEQLAWEGKTPDAPVLTETRTQRFFELPDGTRGIDLTVALTAPKEAVVLGDTKEAGLASARVHPAISAKETVVITNSTGKTGEKTIWGKPADWADESGVIDGKPYGIAIFDHPDNPKHPATWHIREYGLITANIWGLHDYDPKNVPKGTGDTKIEAGKTVTFKYRILFHTGNAESAKLAEKYKDWVAR